ncbi:phosphotransferase family protein [Pacificimonas sp. ICDLI1SI03]
MTNILDDSARDEALRCWIESLGYGTIADVKRVGGGAFRTSARIEMKDRDDGKRPIFVKVDLGSAPPTPFDLQREYQVLKAIGGRVKAPDVLGYEPDLNAMAMPCLPGVADYGQIEDGTKRARVERSYVEALLAVHRLDLSSLSLDHLPAGLTIRQAIAADLDLWRDLLLNGVAHPDAITLFALAWCAARLPDDSRPATLVQGDAGPGNFLFDEDGVTGVLDWEMAHVGHPLEDIGCILVRSLVQPMASANDLLGLYSQASGVEWTRQELLYSAILMMARFSVPISLALESRNTGLDFGLTNGYFRMSQISLLRLIAQAEGIELNETIPDSAARPTADFEFEYLRSVLRDIVRPAVADDYVRYRLDGAVGLIGYLGGALADSPEGAEGDAHSAFTEQERIVAGGGGKLAAAMQQMYGDALYREQLMREMLGPLHGRRIVI